MDRDVIPFATRINEQMPTKGQYKNGWPVGAIVHYTAGRNHEGAAMNTAKGGIKDGFTYLTIDVTGEIIQAHPVSRWGYHAGRSSWPGFLSGVNSSHIGIEICSPGKLEVDKKTGKLMTWFKTEVKKEDARFVMQSAWGCPTGWYAKFSVEQETALIRVLSWLKNADPTGKTFSFDQVLGHHEVSGLKGLGIWRKTDPGGSLSLPMDEFRGYLKRLEAEKKSQVIEMT